MRAPLNGAVWHFQQEIDMARPGRKYPAARDSLVSIMAAANALIYALDAGGERQHAAQCCVDEQELQQCDTMLHAMLDATDTFDDDPRLDERSPPVRFVCHNTLPGLHRWHVGVVTRPDAGGTLYAPVRYVDNVEIEHGMTPSHDRDAMQRAVDQLNARTQA